MIGAIIGDIAGPIYEHHPIKTTEFPLWSPGCRFTDDTVLTVAVADVLLNGGDYTWTFRDYYHRFPGAGYGGWFHGWARSPDPRPYGSWGNGSAMRVSPLGLWFHSLEETLAEAGRSAALTHNHPKGIAGAKAVAACIFLARHGADKFGDVACIHVATIELAREGFGAGFGFILLDAAGAGALAPPTAGETQWAWFFTRPGQIFSALLTLRSKSLSNASRIAGLRLR